MPNVSIDINGERVQAPIVPEGWYLVKVINVPEIKEGKTSGKKYMHWIFQVIAGKYTGVPLECNTTLEKGENPLKSKRWLFHQAMAACGIKKNDQGKYEFMTENLVDNKFYIRVIVKQDEYTNYENKTVKTEKNEVKEIAFEPREAIDPDEIPF